MRIEFLDEAQDDLVDGFQFYEEQSPGVGSYFLDSLFSDIDSLLLHAGTHRIVYGSHRSVASRFPYAIYYRVELDVVAFAPSLTVAATPLGFKEDCAAHPAVPSQALQCTVLAGGGLTPTSRLPRPKQSLNLGR